MLLVELRRYFMLWRVIRDHPSTLFIMRELILVSLYTIFLI